MLRLGNRNHLGMVGDVAILRYSVEPFTHHLVVTTDQGCIRILAEVHGTHGQRNAAFHHRVVDGVDRGC